MGGPGPPVTGERGRDEHAPAVEETKAALRHLAGADPRSVIDRAAAAVDDLDAAAAFVEDVGVDGLARAVEATEDPAVQARGERTLAAFKRFRAAAVGDPVLGGAVDGDHDADADLDAGGDPAGHFHPGHDTDLRDGDEATTE